MPLFFQLELGRIPRQENSNRIGIIILRESLFIDFCALQNLVRDGGWWYLISQALAKVGLGHRQCCTMETRSISCGWGSSQISSYSTDPGSSISGSDVCPSSHHSNLQMGRSIHKITVMEVNRIRKNSLHGLRSLPSHQHRRTFLNGHRTGIHHRSPLPLLLCRRTQSRREERKRVCYRSGLQRRILHAETRRECV